MKTTTNIRTYTQAEVIGDHIHYHQARQDSAGQAVDSLSAYPLGCREHMTATLSHPGVWRAMGYMTPQQVGEFVLGEAERCSPLFCSCP